MRILLTGISSFTGSYFARGLVNSGHEIIATLTQPENLYTNQRRQRLDSLVGSIALKGNSAIGTDDFLNAIDNEKQLDIFCLHHASVGDYRSDQFDVAGAIQSATLNYELVAKKLVEKGLSRVVITRSIFESEFGVRSENRAVNLYGVAKKAASEIWKDVFNRHDIEVADFVITNPFGVFEEKRFISYLFNSWTKHETPELKAPTLVRDNIPIPLLADAYVNFVESSQIHPYIPSGIVGTNSEFALLIANKFSSHFGFTPEITHAETILAAEPLILTGNSPVSFEFSQQDEQFWADFVNYYSEGQSK